MDSRQEGFTLVELMIVVAIIGILAALAIPNFQEMTYRSRRAELPVNVNGIKTAEVAYEATNDAFYSTSWEPDANVATLTRRANPWRTSGSNSFDELGWEPGGEVRGQYRVVVVGEDFRVEGRGDMDDDDVISSYTATKSLNVIALTAHDTY